MINIELFAECLSFQFSYYLIEQDRPTLAEISHAIMQTKNEITELDQQLASQVSTIAKQEAEIKKLDDRIIIQGLSVELAALKDFRDEKQSNLSSLLKERNQHRRETESLKRKEINVSICYLFRNLGNNWKKGFFFDKVYYFIIVAQ